MTLDLTHLSAPTREVAFGSIPQRLRHVCMARWIQYLRAELALEHRERLFGLPRCASMPCLLLYGDSGIGKTMILERYARRHPLHFDEPGEREIRPVVTVQMPPAPDKRKLYAGFLDTLGAPFFLSNGLVALETLTRRMLTAARSRILIIDEAHHLFAGTAREQRRALNVLKSLANVLRSPSSPSGSGMPATRSRPPRRSSAGSNPRNRRAGA